MKKIILGLAIISAMVACTADMEDLAVAPTSGDNASEKIINSSTNAQSGELLVRFEPTAESRLAECATRTEATRTGVVGVDAVLDNIGGYAVEPVFVVTEKNRDKVYAAGMHLWYLVKFDKESNLDAVATDLAKVGEVKYLEFVHKVKRIEPKRATAVAKNQTAASIASETRATSNIPFNSQK